MKLIKNIIKKFLNKRGYYRKKNLKNFLEGFLIACISLKGSVNIIQVGANDGKTKDPLFDTINKFNKFVNLLVIEPQEIAFKKLKKNLSNYKNVKFSNKLIGDGKLIDWHTIKDDPNQTGISSVNKTNLSKRHSEKKIVSQKMQSYKLIDVLNEFKIFNEIDLITIDAEGYDDIIIYNMGIDFKRIKCINYEYKNFNKQRYTDLQNYLTTNNFNLQKWSTSDEFAFKIFDK
jgi:FkbM family methyltransferase